MIILDARSQAEAYDKPADSDILLGFPLPPYDASGICEIADVLEYLIKIGELDPREPVGVFCAKGIRSALVTAILKHWGFDVTDLGALK